MHLPFSQACENNKHPILKVISPLLTQAKTLLEVGSGTGQHAEYFAQQLPHLRWQASDQAINLPHLNCRFNLAELGNLPLAIELDVSGNWPVSTFDAIYTANTLHIMSKPLVESFFNGLAIVSKSNSQLFIYGPFNYQGQFTSQSNADFHVWLTQNNPLSGIRDIEWIMDLAVQQGFQLQTDFEMPANNRLLHFSR
ncbi:DUF938 domain-containing protein [Shewanella aestuarii]|uniref:DUF938 domain-containing protein n=1 Tax=Shewanella aestuarii TaxID=1028752 RepID=A0A6G9QNL9_9GAMM|nr:DUF938 domain-containing protein [Shewanella aestuarii]QIR16184.1 DUF938 domain-containing protein [Shewanella aestuarii]